MQKTALLHLRLKFNDIEYVFDFLFLFSSQKLDVEGSAWVTNESIPSLVNMRLRELNTSKCSISVSGVAAILQNMKNLLVIDGGIPFVDVLEYQDEITQTCLELRKKLKIEDFQVNILIYHFLSRLQILII